MATCCQVQVQRKITSFSLSCLALRMGRTGGHGHSGKVCSPEREKSKERRGGAKAEPKPSDSILHTLCLSHWLRAHSGLVVHLSLLPKFQRPSSLACHFSRQCKMGWGRKGLMFCEFSDPGDMHTHTYRHTRTYAHAHTHPSLQPLFFRAGLFICLWFGDVRLERGIERSF